MVVPEKRRKWEQFILRHNDLFDTSYIAIDQQTDDEVESDDEIVTISTKKVIPSISEDSDKSIAKPAKKKQQPQSNRKMIRVKPVRMKSQQTDTTHTNPLSVVSQLHKKYISANPYQLHEEFNANTELWHEYHKAVAETESKFAKDDQQLIPHKRIIQYLETLQLRRPKYIADLGCGEARISKHFKGNKLFEFYNYDHVACDSTVTRANISRVPLDDNMVNYAIICLSMWGRNCGDYIKEAYRILEDNGILLIIETTKRWIKDGENKLEKILMESDFKVRNSNWDAGSETEDKFLFMECVRE